MKTAKPKSSDAMLSECGHETQLLRGFTLIELLVVVAIIALLVAILVPSLNRAREQAKKVVCLSNLHQIGVAVHCYTNDNSGRMPGYQEDMGDWPAGWLYASLKGYRAYIHDQWFMGGNKRTDINPRKLNIYVANAETVFRCPADQGYVNVSPNNKWYPDEPEYETWYKGSYMVGNSYLYNAVPGTRWNPTIRVLASKQISVFKYPSRQVIFGDATLSYTWLDPSTDHSNHQIQELAGRPWHDLPNYHSDADAHGPTSAYGYTVLVYDPLANLLFLDGHAATVRLEQKFITSDYVVYDGS